jgi:hypothetical protein
MRNFGFVAAFALIGLATTACSSSSPPAQGMGNATDAAPGDGAFVNCTTDPLAQTFAAGMKVPGATGTFQFEIVQVNIENAQGQQVAAPPALGINQWIVKVLDKSGTPVAGLSFPPLTTNPWPASWPVGVLPYMPHHGHPSSLWPAIMGSSDGTYTIDNVDLYMPGLWQVTINAKSPTVTDSGVFGFCIQG